MDSLTIILFQKILVEIRFKSQTSKIIRVINPTINDILNVDNWLFGSKATRVNQNIRRKRIKKVKVAGIKLFIIA